MELANPNGINAEGVKERIQDSLVVAVLARPITGCRKPCRPNRECRRVGQADSRVRRQPLDRRVLKRAVDDREKIRELLRRRLVAL